MLSRHFLISFARRSFQTSTCCQHKAGSQINKQVKMLKKIIAGREKGKRRFVYSENLPKLESVSKLSNNKGQGKESNRRITVLNKLFMKNITDLMATDKFRQSIFGYGLQVTLVKVSPDFRSLNVFWLAQGDEKDLELEKILSSIAGPIRHELSQLRLMGEIPRIFFVKDKFFSKAVEVDALLKRADFGDDFVPTDPTIFIKTTAQLQMQLSDDMKRQIYEIDDFEEVEEDELPEMNDVMGLDHSAIMNKIAISIDKSKKAWESFGTKSDSVMSSTEPGRDLDAVNQQIAKLNKEAELREEFMKFLERKQYTRRETPERKKNKNLNPQEDLEHDDDYRDPLPDGDYIYEDHDEKK